MDQLQRAALVRANAAIGTAISDGTIAANRKTFCDLAVGLAMARAADEMGLFDGHPVLKDYSTKAGLLGDAVWRDHDIAQLVAAFITSIAPVSIFDVLARYAVRVPANNNNALLCSGFAADVVAEGFPKAVYGVDLSRLPTEAQKAAGLVVLSSGLLGTPAGDAVFLRELEKAVLRATNAAVLATALNNSPTANVGGGATLTGLRNALAASVPSQGYVVVTSSPAVTQFSTLPEVRGDIGIRGGEFTPGIHMVPHDDMPGGVAMVVIAASRAAFADHGLILKPSRQANVQLSETPAAPVAANTVLTSLFQSGLVALLAERSFRLAIDDPAVVVVGA